MVDFADGAWQAASVVSPENAGGVPPQAGGAPAGRRATGCRRETTKSRSASRSGQFGTLSVKVKDHLARKMDRPTSVPHSRDNDYGPEAIAERQRFVEEVSGAKLTHAQGYSFDPALTRGNIENFTGVAQVPLGIAGPLQVNGEHARGEFLIPLATSEGTLVASYNRGMKVLNLSGGVTCTVQADHMQRAPVFIFDSAREARAFRDWVDDHMADIRREAESTTRVGKLQYIDTYLASKFAYLRFNYSTGRRRGPEHGRPGHLRGLQLDPRPQQDDPAVLPRIEPGHRQEGLPGEPDAHPGQAGHRGGDDQA